MRSEFETVNHHLLEHCRDLIRCLAGRNLGTDIVAILVDPAWPTDLGWLKTVRLCENVPDSGAREGQATRIPLVTYLGRPDRLWSRWLNRHHLESRNRHRALCSPPHRDRQIIVTCIRIRFILDLKHQSVSQDNNATSSRVVTENEQRVT